ncbi:hypothetical protein HMPREF3038_01868 [Akkermansia sp. KLE1797]|nr:hypothetical protein HMPREF3038_01868 [Akkermansia sp. KLE1797]
MRLLYYHLTWFFRYALNNGNQDQLSGLCILPLRLFLSIHDIEGYL